MTTAAEKLSRTPTEDSVPASVNAQPASSSITQHTRLSELSTQLRVLQSQTAAQTTEIYQLKRQIKLLSELKGVSVGKRQFWEERERFVRVVLGDMSEEKDTMEDSNCVASGENINTDNDTLVMQHSELTVNTDTNTNQHRHKSTYSSLASSLNNSLQQIHTQYDNYDEAQLEEFARIVSPKVSELLSEQALALDSFLGSNWSSSSDDDSDKSRKQRRKRRGKSKKGELEDDEDGMNEEERRLEKAQMSLRDELELATNGFNAFLQNDSYDDEPEYEDDVVEGSDYHSNNEHTESTETTANDSKADEWNNSIHQYYKDNTPSKNGSTTSTPTIATNNGIQTPQALLSKLKLSYSLSDHAVTLDVSRLSSDRGLFTRPLLSRNELETLNVVTLPEWIARPGGDNLAAPTVQADPNGCILLEQIDNTSRGREAYMKRILNCTTEYIEPPKSKTLRKLFSGWNPGPGERRVENDNARHGIGEDTHRVMAYSPALSPDDDGDSSIEAKDSSERDQHFEDVEGVSYASQSHWREPIPVRTVTVRIRPDVLCGAVMDALTTSVEKLGGEITKRQGGHLRAVLPGRSVRAWLPGELESIAEQDKVTNGDTPTDASFQRIGSTGSSGSGDDVSSIASGISSLLFTSPKQRSQRMKGPKYVLLPPCLLDSQLLTKKSGKECQRLLLIRVYRIQDVACLNAGEEDEILDVPVSFDSSEDTQVQPTNISQGDVEAESEKSLQALQEAAALVQRIKAEGGEGFAIDQPPPMLGPLDEVDGDTASVFSHTSTKSYLRYFGDAITSPIRYFGSPTPYAHTPSPYQGSSKSKTRQSSQATVIELMSSELLRNYRSSPSVGTSSKSAMYAAKLKSHGVFPSLSKEDSPYVRGAWMFLRECISELDQRCLTYR